MARGNWDKKDVIHGANEAGDPVTLKRSKDSQDFLLAPGHVEDIQPGTDHVHGWNQKSGTPGHHDTRDRSRRMFPDVPDNWDAVQQTKDRLIHRAEQLAYSTNWKEGGDGFRKLQSEWKSAGRGKRDIDDQQWSRFNAARDRFTAARSAFFEQRDRESDSAKREKERIVSRAESLASSSDTRSASKEMRELMDAWKKAGRAKKEDEDRLWDKFNAARTRLHDAITKERNKRESEQANAKSAKRAIVSAAQNLAYSSDLRAARDEMRRLQDKWKTAGRASREDEDALWKDFKKAQDTLFQKANAEREKREREQKEVVATKERIISQIKSLVSTSDFRSAADQVKSLSDQYFAAGSAGREHNERLKSAFQGAKQAFFDAKKREGERKKAEWEANKRQRISEMENRIREMESRIWQARSSLSDAWSQLTNAQNRPQPSWSNPRRSEIMSRQYDRIQSINQRIARTQERIGSMEMKVASMRQKLQQLMSR